MTGSVLLMSFGFCKIMETNGWIRDIEWNSPYLKITKEYKT